MNWSHHKTTIEIARMKTDSEKSKKYTYNVKIQPSHMALSKQLQLNISPTATDPREKKNVTDHKKSSS